MDQEEDRIRQRAHQLWEEEGRPEGRAEDHWSRARQELQGGSDPAQSDSTAEDPAAAASAAAVSGIDLASGSEPSPAEVEQSMLKGDDGPTPYLNADTGRAKRG